MSFNENNHDIYLYAIFDRGIYLLFKNLITFLKLHKYKYFFHSSYCGKKFLFQYLVCTSFGF